MRVLEQHSIVIEGRGYTDATKNRYETTVSGMVQGIAMTKAGKILLHWIKNSGTHRDWALIIPYANTDKAKEKPCNADATYDLWPVMIGTREVMATRVRFSPETFMNMSPCSAGPNRTPVEVLVHELVHAQRHLSRIANDYDEEEFFAIVFTNVWASTHSVTSVTASGLRSNHAGGQLISPDDDSNVWMTNKDNFRLVEKYCRQQPKLTREMGDIAVKFNPFRTYYTREARRAG